MRYADLCAYRAKLHIEANRTLNDNDGASTCTSAQDSDIIHLHEEQIIKELNEWVKVRMYRSNRAP